MTTHRLEPAPGTTHDVFSRDHSPAASIDPGDTVVVRSLDASGHLARQTFPGEQQAKMFAEPRGHCLTGPIEVRGAQPGDLIALRLRSLRPGDWGWTVAAAADTPVTRRLGLAGGPPSWLLWELDPDAGKGTNDRGISRPLAPFLGVMGVAPAAPGEHSTIPPRAECGGNIDCKELVAGSTLFLPVAVPGALLYLGDGHAAQGDGEVGGTAIECPMTTEATVDLIPADLAAARPLTSVHAETPAGRIAFGFDADLNAAMGDALDAMVTWMQRLYDLDKATALALASTCVDLRVTQVANQTWGVHAVLPDGLLSLGETSRMPQDRDVQAFDDRAASYESGRHGQLHKEISDRVVKLALSRVPAPRRVLDVGCGTGYVLRQLAARLPRTSALLGVDAAPKMIEVAVGVA